MAKETYNIMGHGSSEKEALKTFKEGFEHSNKLLAKADESILEDAVSETYRVTCKAAKSSTDPAALKVASIESSIGFEETYALASNLFSKSNFVPEEFNVVKTYAVTKGQKGILLGAVKDKDTPKEPAKPRSPPSSATDRPYSGLSKSDLL